MPSSAASKGFTPPRHQSLTTEYPIVSSTFQRQYLSPMKHTPIKFSRQCDNGMSHAGPCHSTGRCRKIDRCTSAVFHAAMEKKAMSRRVG